MEEIKVTIQNDGQVKVEGFGFVGKGCDVTTALEESLGMIQSRSDKDEYFKQELNLRETNEAG